MKQLLFFCALVLSVFSVSAQTNTWTGASGANWDVAGNWSLGLPTGAHDVVIPTGSILNMNTLAEINSITTNGTVTINMTGTLDFIAPSSLSTGTTINWSTGTLTGGGTLVNNGIINLSTSSNKNITGGTTLNNEGTINIVFSGDLYITDGIVNNQLAGVIDMQADAGNLSYSATGSHVLNNFGLIKRTTSTGIAVIECDLLNTGTLSVESGTMSLADPGIELSGGVYNISSGAALAWTSALTVSGALTGLNNGAINWTGTVTVPSTTQWNFTGTGHINWSTGTLNGGGTVTNNSVIDLSTSSNKSISGATTFNNAGLINIIFSGDLYVTDGTLNNQAAGVIDMQADAGNLSFSSGASHIMNNYGLIKRTTSTGLAKIENELHNEGTIWVQSGTLNLDNAAITLQNGIYNVNASCFLTWNSTVSLSGTLTGTVTGEITWYDTVRVAAAQTATLGFTGTGNINWTTGTMTGGGTLNHQFTMRLSTSSNKSITGGTTFNNSTLIYNQFSGDLYITDGIMNNLASGTIDLRADAGNLSFSSGASHILNNFGFIKKTTSLGSVSIECDLVNTGTISVESGTLVLDNSQIQLNGGTYNVTSGTTFEWRSAVNCSGTLNGLVNGTVLWLGTTTVSTAATVNFAGTGSITWNSGTLNGGGTMTHNFAMNLATSSNKSIAGATTLNNNGTINFTFSGDLYITDGIVNNQITGIIDLQMDAGNLSYSSGASHVLNNFGLIKKTNQTGTTVIECLVNNSGTIDAQVGTINLAGDFVFTNNADGVITGVATIDLPPLASFTNNGIFAPGGNPGTLSVIGPFEMETSAQIAVDLNGLTPGTGYDVLAITGNAALNGSVDVNLGFAPAINDTFIVATTTGTISTCVGSGTTSAIRNDLEYTFIVTCVDNNKLALTVFSIEAVPPITQAQVFCNGATVADLEATGTNIQWYAAEIGGSPLAAGTVLVTGTYYATQTVDGFESDRVGASVTVNTTPQPTASAQVFNDVATVADLVATGTLLQWYPSEVGGAPLATDTVLETGTYYVSQTLNGCESTRLAVSVTVDLENFFFYVDADGDGFGTGSLVEVEEGPEPPAGYSVNNTDCDDTNNTIWQSANLFIDIDGDGYDNGSETVCYGAAIPTGYSQTTSGADCNDADADLNIMYPFYADADLDGFGSVEEVMACAINASTPPSGYSTNNTDCNDLDANVWTSATLFIDADGDGYDNGSEDVCYGATIPTGYAETTLGTDCDDTDDQIFQSVSLFIDADGDGYDSGSEVFCAGDTIPPGYSETTLGTDCDDNDASAFQSASLFIDNDSDGYDAGTQTVCYGASVPTGYSATTNGTDCDDNNAAVNPAATEIAGNGIDDNCNGATDEGGNITTTLTPASCGSTLANLNTLVGIVSLQGATAYRVRATNTTTLVQQTIIRNAPNFRMNMFASYDYATTYTIDIEVQMNGIFVGYYGPSCNVSTPAILVPGGAAQVTPSQCGITLANMNTLIATTSLAGVTGYRFRVTNLTDNSAPNQVQTIDRQLHWFSLPMLATYTYGTTYRIEVAMKTTGDYSAYGSPCSVTTPAVPSLTQCGGTVATANTFVTTTSLQNVAQYRFELTNTANSQLSSVQTPYNRFTFSQVAGYAPGQTYQVRVAVMTSGVWSLLGGVCTITAPGILVAKSVAANTDAKVWPNPFTEDFTVGVESGTNKKVSVYDMLGRLVEQQQIESDAQSFKLGAQYPSGVYNLIVTDDGGTQTIRVIKR